MMKVNLLVGLLVALLPLLALPGASAQDFGFVLPETGEVTTEQAATTEEAATEEEAPTGTGTTEEGFVLPETQQGVIAAGEDEFQAEHAPPRNECDITGFGCPDDKWCDKDEIPRKCWDKRPLNAQCNRDEKCLSNCCEANKCVACGVSGGDPCEHVACDPGEHCHDGECHVDHTEDPCEGLSCPNGWHCDNGRCVREGNVCDTVECPAGQICDSSRGFPVCVVDVDLCANIRCETGFYCYEGHCYSKDPCFGINCVTGEYCVDGECVNENPCANTICAAAYWCHDGDCYPPFCSSDRHCPPGYTCNSQDTCVAVPACFVDQNCDVGEVCQDGICVADPTRCRDDFQCPSHAYCRNGECLPYCYRQSQCPTEFFCDAATHQCNERLANRENCDANHECSSGFCNTRRRPNRCHPGYPLGRYCTADYECRSGMICHNNRCAFTVGIGEDCRGDDELCSVGVCSCTTGLCARLKPENARCQRGCECQSDFCNFNQCTEKFGLGHVCSTDDQCESGSCDTCTTAWKISRRKGGKRNSWICEPTCVPILGEKGDYCTASFQCQTDNCSNNNRCVENTNLRRHADWWN